MKQWQVLVLLTFLCLPLCAQDREIKQKQITVTGSVELKETADQASLVFSIKGVGSTLRQAVEDANSKVKAVTDKLIGIGVKEKNISTSEFYSGENSGDKAFLSSSRDYKATISTQVKVDSLKLLAPVIFSISESQVQNLSDIYFGLKDDLAFKKKVRIAAAEKAREKAQDLLTAVGATLGNVLSVDELSGLISSFTTLPARGVQGYPNRFNSSTTGTPLDESMGSGFFAKTISISSQVRVTFEIK